MITLRYMAGIIIGFLLAVAVIPYITIPTERERLVVVRVPVMNGYGDTKKQRGFYEKLLGRLFGDQGHQPGN